MITLPPQVVNYPTTVASGETLDKYNLICFSQQNKLLFPQNSLKGKEMQVWLQENVYGGVKVLFYLACGIAVIFLTAISVAFAFTEIGPVWGAVMLAVAVIGSLPGFSILGTWAPNTPEQDKADRWAELYLIGFVCVCWLLNAVAYWLFRQSLSASANGADPSNPDALPTPFPNARGTRSSKLPTRGHGDKLTHRQGPFRPVKTIHWRVFFLPKCNDFLLDNEHYCPQILTTIFTQYLASN